MRQSLIPTTGLIGEPEANLVISVVRTLLNYLEDKRRHRLPKRFRSFTFGFDISQDSVASRSGTLSRRALSTSELNLANGSFPTRDVRWSRVSWWLRPMPSNATNAKYLAGEIFQRNMAITDSYMKPHTRGSQLVSEA